MIRDIHTYIDRHIFHSTRRYLEFDLYRGGLSYVPLCRQIDVRTYTTKTQIWWSDTFITWLSEFGRRYCKTSKYKVQATFNNKKMTQSNSHLQNTDQIIILLILQTDLSHKSMIVRYTDRRDDPVEDCLVMLRYQKSRFYHQSLGSYPELTDIVQHCPVHSWYSCYCNKEQTTLHSLQYTLSSTCKVKLNMLEFGEYRGLKTSVIKTNHTYVTCVYLND